MKTNSLLKGMLLILAGSLLGEFSVANTAMDNPLPLNHCYHWLQQGRGYMDFKYDYAAKNENELTFFTTPATSNGSVAGPGLYCAKSPSGSFSYGDRVIRIEFVRDVVFLDAFTNKKYCGTDGKFYKDDQECQSKDWDVKYYSKNADWYVIQNPRAIFRWTATDNQIVQDLKADLPYANAAYPAHIQNALTLISQDIAKNGNRTFLNSRARLGFIQIVKNKDLLRSIPALQILAELNGEDAKKIDAKTLKAVTDSTIARIYQDQYLPWGEVRAAIEKNSSLKKSFIELLPKQLEALKSGKAKSQNLATIVMVASMKGSGIAPEQTQNLVETLFNNPKNVIYARFSKEDLDPTTKKVLEQAVLAKSASPETKKDLDTIVALMSFANGNALEQSVRADVQETFYEHIKGLGKSRFFLTDGQNKYPLADTAKKAVQLCQAHISAYQLLNKPLSIGSGDMKFDIGEAPDVPSIATLCTAQAEMLKAIASIKDGKGKVYVIEGTIGKLPFKFIGTDSDTLAPQVEAFVKSNNILKGDTIYYSVNGSARQKIYTSGYWTQPNHFSSALLGHAKSQGISSQAEKELLAKIEKMGEGKARTIEVAFNMSEKLFVTFKVDTVEDLNEQCQVLAPKLQNIKFDTMFYTLDSVKKQKIYTGGYWTNAIQTCGALTDKLASVGLLKKSEIAAFKKIEQLAKGKKNEIKITLAGFQILMGADKLEDFDQQCALISAKFPNYSGYAYYNISFGTYAGSKRYIYGNNSTTKDLCEAYRKVFYASGLAPQAEMDAMNEITRLSANKKNKIGLKFENFEFEVGANTIEDFRTFRSAFVKIFNARPIPRLSYFNLNEQGYRHVASNQLSAEETFDNITQGLASQGLPSQFLLELVTSKAKYKYSFDIRSDGLVFPIVANDYDSILENCITNFAKMGRSTFNSPTLLINANTTPVLQRGNVTAADTCRQAKAFLFGTVPSEEQVQILKIQARWTIEAKFGFIPMTFKVNNSEQLYGQCLNLFDEAPKNLSLERPTIDINGLGAKPLPRTENGREFCKMLSTQVKLRN